MTYVETTDPASLMDYSQLHSSKKSKEKDDLRWMIFSRALMNAHNASPIPGVTEALKAIDSNLKHAPDAPVDAFGEKMSLKHELVRHIKNEFLIFCKSFKLQTGIRGRRRLLQVW